MKFVLAIVTALFFGICYVESTFACIIEENEHAEDTSWTWLEEIEGASVTIDALGDLNECFVRFRISHGLQISLKTEAIGDGRPIFFTVWHERYVDGESTLEIVFESSILANSDGRLVHHGKSLLAPGDYKVQFSKFEDNNHSISQPTTLNELTHTSVGSRQKLVMAEVQLPDAMGQIVIQDGRTEFTIGSSGTEHHQLNIEERTWVELSVRAKGKIPLQKPKAEGDAAPPSPKVEYVIYDKNLVQISPIRRAWSKPAVGVSKYDSELYLLPAGQYSLVSFLDISDGDISLPNAPIELNIIKSITSPPTKIEDKIIHILSPIKPYPEGVYIFEYKDLITGEFDGRDAQILYEMFSHAGDVLQANGLDFKGREISELYDLYDDFFENHKIFTGKSDEWRKKHRFPRYLVRVESPHFFGTRADPFGEHWVKVDWAEILIQISELLEVEYHDVMLFFPVACHPRSVALIFPELASVFGETRCASTSFSEPVPGSADLSKTTPLFVKQFAPSGAKISFERLSKFFASATIRNIRSHAIVNGTPWERLEVIFTISHDQNAKKAELSVVVDGRYVHGVGENYPPDTQFIYDMEVGFPEALAEYGRRLLVNFDKYLNDGDHYVK